MDATLNSEQDLNREELNLLHRISQSLSWDISLRDALQLIVSTTADLMDSRIVSILLHDEAKGVLSIAATQSLSEAYRNKPDIKLDQSISGRAVKAGKPMAVADVRIEDGYGFQDIARKEGIVSLLCVPMVVRNRTIGVINSYTSRPHTHSDREVALLSMVASMAATTIENARLNAATAAIQQDLEARKTLERAKGILMAERGLSEPEAFRLIQKQSMNTRTPMKKIADAIIMANEVR